LFSIGLLSCGHGRRQRVNGARAARPFGQTIDPPPDAMREGSASRKWSIPGPEEGPESEVETRPIRDQKPFSLAAKKRRSRREKRPAFLQKNRPEKARIGRFLRANAKPASRDFLSERRPYRGKIDRNILARLAKKPSSSMPNVERISCRQRSGQ